MVELSALGKQQSTKTAENKVVLLIKISNFGELYIPEYTLNTR